MICRGRGRQTRSRWPCVSRTIARHRLEDHPTRRNRPPRPTRRAAPRGPKKRGGRKRKIVQQPKIVEAFHDILAEQTAGSPVDPNIIWTDLTACDIAESLTARGLPVSVHIVDQLLDEHDYHRRKSQKQVPMKESADRDAQFQIITRLVQEFRDAGEPIVSMDSKKRELIGNFHRPGVLLTRETIHTFDHDYPSFASGFVIPHGLYDVGLNRGYLHLGTSADTSEFACDCLLDWWERFGCVQYADAKSLLLQCDGGGSNRSTGYLFKSNLQELADATGLSIRVCHYPPYCSKYNPIEHRLFCHVSRACQGVVFESVSIVQELMRKTRTRQGLSVLVDVVDRVYAKGRTVAAEVIASLNLIRDAVLPKLNYRIEPRLVSK